MSWEPVPAPPALSPGEVQVWRACLEVPESRRSACLDFLTPEELERAERYRFDEPRRRFVVARGTLRSLLGAYIGTPPRDLQLAYGAHGKPSVAEPAGDLTFNLSHSGDWMLLAFARCREVGVDVERTLREVSWEAVARRFFEGRELTALEALPAAEQRPAFFRCWTRKEAYMKATGRGMALGLSSFAVTLGPEELPALSWLEAGDPADWGLADVDVGPGHAGAVCAAGRDWVPRFLTAE